MFKHIVTQVSGRLTALFTQVLALLKELLLRLVSYLLASCILVFLSVVKLYNLVVRIVLNIKVWLVSLTKVDQSIKAALTSAKVKVIHLGQLLLITVRKIRQLVPTAQLQRKGKPVGITKSARSHLSVNKTAQTNTVNPLIQDGLKYQGRAKRHRPRAKQPLKAKL